MADKPKYASIIDEFLDEREPNWNELGLKDAKKSGDEWLDRTHDEVDSKFMDEIAEGASHHTAVPPTSKGATLQNRLLDKENAAPRLGASRPASTRTAARPEDYKNSISDDQSILDEVTESLDSAENNGRLEKKNRSDAEIQRYIRTLLNDGVAPAKVAAKLEKLAELELFNRQMATDYLNRNAGLLGMAYLQPNSFMDNCSQTYERMGKKGAIRAKSVKQISACEGCSYFGKNGSQKTCNLYHLPVVGSEKELAGIVNKVTAGVPAASKKAALVQIANRVPETVQANKSEETPIGRVASFTHERERNFGAVEHFGGSHVMKLHKAGHSLKEIHKAAEKKFGTLEASKAIKEFVGSLKAEKGKIVVAKADADYLKKMGIHNSAIVGAAKCASCSAHSGKAQHKAAKTEGVSLAPQKFIERTPERIRAAQVRKTVDFNAEQVAKLHTAGYSIAKIHKAASQKVGDVAAKKAITEFIASMKTRKTKVALSQLDCKYLKNKLGMQNPIEGASKCASCTYRHGMTCSFTGGTLVSFPGMNTAESNHKIASGAPEDGRAMLKEFDLYSAAPQNDIEIKAPERADIEMSNKPDAGEI